MNFKGNRLVSGLVIGVVMMTSAIGYVDAAEGILQDPKPVLSEGGALAGSVEVSADIGLYSSYLWRGFTLNSDPVMQQGFTVATEYGVSLGFWSSIDLQLPDAKGGDDDGDADEVDLWIDYSRDFEDVPNLGTVSGSVGLTYYTFPSRTVIGGFGGGGGRTAELYVSASVADMFLSPSVALYLDYDDEGDADSDPSSKGIYLAGSVSHSLPVTDLLKDIPGTIDLGATLGINSNNFLDGSGFHLDLSASADVPLTDKITFGPSLTIVLPLGDYSDSKVAGGDQDTGFALGFNLGFGF